MPKNLATPTQPQEETMPPAEGQATQPEAGKTDPKIQRQYDMFMAYCVKIIHSEKFADTVVDGIMKITDRNKAIDMIGQATFKVITRVETAAAQKGAKIHGSVLQNAANQVAGEIIGIAEIVGLPKLSEDERAQAFSYAASLYLDDAVKTGKMTPEEVQQIAEQAKQTPQGQKIVAKQAEVQQQRPQGQQAGQMPQQAPPMRGGGLAAPKGGM